MKTWHAMSAAGAVRGEREARVSRGRHVRLLHAELDEARNGDRHSPRLEGARRIGGFVLDDRDRGAPIDSPRRRARNERRVPLAERDPPGEIGKEIPVAPDSRSLAGDAGRRRPRRAPPNGRYRTRRGAGRRRPGIRRRRSPRESRGRTIRSGILRNISCDASDNP